MVKRGKKPYVVLGGGVAGLATAWKLTEAGHEVIVFEKNTVVGGMAGTFSYKGYQLDYGPHKIYSQLPIFEEVKAFLKKDLLSVNKTSKICLCGKYLNYPFGIKDLLVTLNPFIAFKCGFTYAMASFFNLFRTKKDTSYKSYILNRFGSGTYDLVFGPYAEKAWGNPSKLDSSLAASRIAIPSLFEMVKRMFFGDQGKKELSAATFYYPAKGAVEMAERMVDVIQNKGNQVLCNVLPTKIHIENGKATALSYVDLMGNKDGHEKKGTEHTLEVAGVISTIPMKAFASLLPQIPDDVSSALTRLKFRKLILLYIEVNKDRLFPENWLFFPETKYLFNRLSEQKGFSEHMIPKGKTILCAEMTFDQDDPRASLDDETLFKLVIPQLEKCGILKREDIQSYFTKHLHDGYPIYHVDYRQDVDCFLQHVEHYEGVFSIGRQGMFNYVGTIDCIDMGATTAAFIVSQNEKSAWPQERKKFENYVTID